jgi:microcystin-dependent protein
MEPYYGQIVLFAGNFAPVGWLSCNGQLLSISENNILYALLGTTYGGDGVTTFALPDLRDRIPTHSGNGIGLSAVVQGNQYGATENVLNTNQIPSHTHLNATATVRVAASSTDSEDSESPIDSYLRATPGVSTYASTADKLMGPSAISVPTSLTPPATVAVPNIQPTLAMNYIIATTGIYPTQQ